MISNSGNIPLRTTELSSKQIVDAFLLLEERCKVFEQKIAGVFFWEHIRCMLFEMIQKKIAAKGMKALQHKPHMNRFQKTISALKSIFNKNPFFIPKADILFFVNPRRQLCKDGKWWDIYTDPIIDITTVPYVVYEEYYNNDMHFTPAKPDRIYFGDLFRVFSKIISKIWPVQISGQEKGYLSILGKEIKSLYNVSINVAQLTQNTLNNRKTMMPFYSHLLKKVKPSLAVVVCSYDPSKEFFIESCKKKGIPSCEIQHGIISRYKMGYSFPGSFRAKYSFPDYLLCFGDYWRRAAEFPISSDNIKSLGFPFLQRDIDQFRTAQKCKEILFISQAENREAFSKFALDTARLAPKDFRILFKLHPMEIDNWKKYYPDLVDTRIEVIDDRKSDLRSLLAKAKIQISVWSIGVYEGLVLGCVTYVLDLPGVEHLQDLIEEGYVMKVTSAQEIDYGGQLHKMPKPSDIFSPDWESNWNSFLREIKVLN